MMDTSTLPDWASPPDGAPGWTPRTWSNDTIAWEHRNGDLVYQHLNDQPILTVKPARLLVPKERWWEHDWKPTIGAFLGAACGTMIVETIARFH